MLKKLFFVKAILVSFLMVFVMASVVMALEIRTLDTWGPYQTGSGGEFTLVPQDGLEGVLISYVPGTTSNFLQSGTFQSFCVEATGGEYIYKKTTYDVTLSNSAIYGGTGQGGPGDPISKGTAWLYHQFQLGTLTGQTAAGDSYAYDYTGANHPRTTDADYLQKAIWWLEDEASDPGSENPFRNKVNALFIEPKADNNGVYPVAVLNLWAEGHVGEWGYRRQDQLFCTPVPEPATMLLLGSGLIGLAGFARKKLKKQF